MKKLPMILILLGAVVGLLALFVGFSLFPKKLKEKVTDQQGRLFNGSSRWDSWVKVPIPIFQRLYIFNVTNPKDVMKGAKPILQELGPFIYQQQRYKTEIEIDEENDTLKYRQHDDYFFRPDMSNGSLDDRITVVNLPYLGVVAKALGLGGFSRYMITEILNPLDENLYVDITVDEFLFGGYYVPFMQELSEISGEELLPNNTFGLYYNKNGSESEPFVINAGVKDPSRFGEVLSYEGKTEMEWYSEPQCNKINGSDGGLLPPFITSDKDFYMFIPGLCRSLKFSYVADEEVLGIPGLRYTIPESFLEDPKTNPENVCYCSDTSNELANCPKGGVWETSACRKGTPIVMSMPHFYAASDIYLNKTEGLNPQKELHEMHIVLEPTTSISIQVKIRVQMNIDIKPTKYFPKLKNIPAMLHPVFWMEQGAGINPEKADLLREKLLGLIAMVQMGTYVGIGVGCVFIVIAILIFICRSNRSDSTKYSPKNASLKKVSTFEINDYTEAPAKSDWTKLSQNDRYTVITPSPIRPRMPLPEERPLMLSNLQNGNSSFNNSSRASSPHSPPVVVAVYPKLSNGEHTPNALYQPQNYYDEVDYNRIHNGASPPRVSSPIRNSDVLGAPFPPTPTKRKPTNELSSTLSMNNAIADMDNTLKDINDTLSTYEN